MAKPNYNFEKRRREIEKKKKKEEKALRKANAHAAAREETSAEPVAGDMAAVEASPASETELPPSKD